MKNGKKPTNSQREFIKSKKLNPENWLVVKDTPEEMVLISRKNAEEKVSKLKIFSKKVGEKR